MLTTREWLLFFAGAQAFHTISHIFLYFTNILPITIFSISFTEQLNLLAIIINAATTVALLWFALHT